MDKGRSSIRFKFRQMSRWPALAWIARLSTAGYSTIEVDHGSLVETGEVFFCEAIWAGEFGAGDLDRTDRLFGSGARVRGDNVTFVSSGSTVDRLAWMRHRDAIYISNSIPCLLNRVEARVDASFKYRSFFNSISRGIRAYQRELPTSAGPLQLTYFSNLLWDGTQIREIVKPDDASLFESYEEYREYLSVTLDWMALNMQSASRRISLTPIAKVGDDYASTTAMVLGKNLGLEEAIDPDQIAGQEKCESILRSLRLNVFSDDSQGMSSVPESALICGDGIGSQSGFHSTHRHLNGRALLTGFAGGRIWDKFSGDSGSDLARDDVSGLSLSEYRLHAGFIHCPLGFLGARHAGDLHRISHSSDMKPWDLGGTASKPLCRRIVESAGIPRYAISNSATTWNPIELSQGSRQEFHQWLAERSGEFWRKKRIPPLSRGRFTFPFCNPKDESELDEYLFPWALERAKQSYVISESIPLVRSVAA
jgi:hypothetical protein